MRKPALLCLALLMAASGHTLGSKPRSSRQKPPESDASVAPQLSKSACRLLYCCTAINPMLSVLANDYKSILSTTGSEKSHNPTAAAVYRTLFYFARLKPRLLFVVGGCLRALQQTTVLQLVFDPYAGVGAGLNLLAWFVSSRWPSPLVLGWSVSKPFWRLLRAAPPPSVHVPISVTPRWRA